jgi:uncharacterized protein (TIGR02266 family)
MKKTAPEVPRIQIDRRRALRSPLIVLQVRIEKGPKTFFGYAKNLSRGGMFISSVNPQELGGHFHVEFILPDIDRTQVSCSCQVVWKRLFASTDKREPGMGLRFLELSVELGEAIDRWVNAGET